MKNVECKMNVECRMKKNSGIVNPGIPNINNILINNTLTNLILPDPVRIRLLALY